MKNRIILRIEENNSEKIININEESYNYFTSFQSLPKSNNPRYRNIKNHWNRMTEIQRLNFHLGEIADGNNFTYEILK